MDLQTIATQGCRQPEEDTMTASAMQETLKLMQGIDKIRAQRSAGIPLSLDKDSDAADKPVPKT